MNVISNCAKMTPILVITSLRAMRTYINCLEKYEIDVA